MAKSYNSRPSQLMAITDPYTAYCLDEACAYIMKELEDGKEIVRRTHYSKPSDLYKKYEI